jgi:hypothetical protein
MDGAHIRAAGPRSDVERTLRADEALHVVEALGKTIMRTVRDSPRGPRAGDLLGQVPGDPLAPTVRAHAWVTG